MGTITLNKKEFIKALNIGGAFAGKSRAMPILDCVKIKVSNGTITIVSSDNENAISKKVKEVESNGDITFCVNYKDFSSYIKLLNVETFNLQVSDNDVKVVHKNGEISLPIMNADEFPALKLGENTKNITINSAVLNNWIVDASNFVANDDLRPILNNIYFYGKENEIGCCSTDTHLMFTDNQEYSGEEFEFNLNKGAFKAVCDVCSGVDEVNVKIGDRNVMFVGDGISVLTRQQDGRFPNFKSIIPTESPIHVKVNKQELLSSINRCLLGASKVTSLIKLQVSSMSLQVSAEDIDFSRKTVENLLVESNGEITIGFNGNDFIKVVSTVSTDNIILNMTDFNKACLIKEDDEKSKKIILEMPILIE